MTTQTYSAPVQQILHLVEQLNREQMQQLLAEIQEQLRRDDLFAQANADFAALRADPGAAAAWDDEQRAWDATLGDGLEQF